MSGEEWFVGVVWGLYIISMLIFLTSCTANIDGVVTHVGIGPHDVHTPDPWVYPDSAFCQWHPDLCK